jgi:hypothetical protein
MTKFQNAIAMVATMAQVMSLGCNASSKGTTDHEDSGSPPTLIKAENKPPLVGFIEPRDGDVVAAAGVDFLVAVSDAQGLSDIRSISMVSDVDGILIADALPDDYGILAASLTLTSLGRHIVTVEARDLAGELGVATLEVDVE